jgi:hypothetical protein
MVYDKFTLVYDTIKVFLFSLVISILLDRLKRNIFIIRKCITKRIACGPIVSYVNSTLTFHNTCHFKFSRYIFYNVSIYIYIYRCILKRIYLKKTKTICICTQTLPLGVSSKAGPANSQDWRSHHRHTHNARISIPCTYARKPYLK